MLKSALDSLPMIDQEEISRRPDFIPTSSSSLIYLQQGAKMLIAQNRIPGEAALDMASRQGGYKSWNHALECNKKTIEGFRS